MNPFATQLAAIVAALLLGACASAPQPQQNAVDQVPQPVGQGSLKLNVRGGYYQVFNSEFSPKGEQIEMALLRRNIHEKWAPTQVVCVGEKVGDREMCLMVASMTTANPNQLKLTFFGWKRESDTWAFEQTIAGNFPVGTPVRLGISFADKVLSFKINDDSIVSRPLEFAPEIVTFRCSSAECTFSFREAE